MKQRTVHETPQEGRAHMPLEVFVPLAVTLVVIGALVYALLFD